eukprot:gene17677-24598_t
MLPKQLKYGSKVESAMAQSYRSNIQPQNGTGPYTLGQTIIINIPTSNNLVLAATESFLKFNVKFTNGATANARAIFDNCGAHQLVQRIRIFHGSNLLQDIDQYGLLAKMLFDLQVPTDACYGKFNELVGTRNDLNVITNAVAAGAAVPVSYLSCKQINSGESYDLGAANSTTADADVRTFCLNLICLLGTLSQNQYIPLFSCTAAPLRLEIQLVSTTLQAIASSSAITSIELNNVEYIGQFIKLSDNAMSMIYYGSLGGQPLEFSVPDYSNYQYSYSLITANSTQQINFAIPAKYSSLKSLFVMMRESTGTLTYFPLSCVNLKFLSYYFRVGSNIIPTKSPDNLPEMFSEVLKAMGSMSDLNYHHPSIEKDSYELVRNATTITTVNYNSINSGSFYIGLDLENYVASNKDTIFAGYNSNTDDIFAVINLNPTANVTPRFDTFANFDSVLVFENGTAYRKF